MRNFIGKQVDQTLQKKYRDKNGVPLRIGDTCRYQFGSELPYNVTVVGFNMRADFVPVTDGVCFESHAGYREWDRADAIARNYEVINP